MRRRRKTWPRTSEHCHYVSLLDFPWNFDYIVCCGRYYKTLFDTDVLDAKLKLLKGGIAQLPLVIKVRDENSDPLCHGLFLFPML